MNPHNVFVTYEGQIKIIDFGLAKAVNRTTKTGAGIVKGKLGYMAPEQATSLQLDRRADIFALGTTLWELTTNRRLFRREEDIETLRAIYAAVVPDPRRFRPNYPVGLWDVVRRALARDREERYPTAEAFGHDLDAFVASGSRPFDADAVAAFMADLFPADRERQLEWMETASGPTPTSLVPLKVPVLSEALIPIAEPAPATAAPVEPAAPPTVAVPDARPRTPEAPDPSRRGSRALVVALVLLALGLVAFVALLATQG
jgi:serine/threonine protein kinase